MKIVAFIGSPRKGGNTDVIVNTICKAAKENGNQINIYYLSDMDNKGCIACDGCQNKTVEYCAINDEVTKLYHEIAKADCIIIGTPIYVGQISGYTKNLLDRFRPFIQPDRTIRDLPGKKYITVTCSSRPAEAFRNATDYLNQWLGGFFQMVNCGNIIAGNLRNRNEIDGQADILSQAYDIGKKLI